jgi:hypothetical protein
VRTRAAEAMIVRQNGAETTPFRRTITTNLGSLSGLS